MILDFLFPKQCLECKNNGKYICEECYCKVRPCNFIDRKNYSIFRYEGIIKKALISLKYKFAYDIADELVGVCVQRLITNHKSQNTFLVPIPLHKYRKNWRGFNQSELIGQKLAKKMGWKYIPDLLIRTKNTKPQVGLRGSARRFNLSNVFVVNPTYNLFAIRYNLVIFDDVYTTGSTINEARKVLQEAGFKNIKSLTIAR